MSEVLPGLSPGFPARELKIVCPCDSRQIRSQEPSGARLSVSATYVARELPETLVRCRLSLMPDDHRCPAKRFTARRTSTIESMSSRFSRW